MIKDIWYIIYDAKRLRTNKPVRIQRLGKWLVLCRFKNGELALLEDQCPHRGVQLSRGKVVDNTIQCPYHGLTFNHEGQCTSIPTEGRFDSIPSFWCTPAYGVQEKYGFIWMYFADEIPNTLPPIKFYEHLEPEVERPFLRSRVRTLHWKCHWTRAIEGQLDPAHVHYLHKWSLAKLYGGTGVVDGPYIEKTEKGFIIQPSHRRQNGERAKKPSEVEFDKTRPYGEIIFPTLWWAWTTHDSGLINHYTPINEEETLIFMAGYQSRFHNPLIAQPLLTFIQLFIYRVFGTEDWRILRYGSPHASAARSNEKLLASDVGIALHRRMRMQVMKEQSTLDVIRTDDNGKSQPKAV